MSGGMKRQTQVSQIPAFYRRWERMEQQRRDLSDDLKELFSEAKAFGLNTKALRAVFAEHYRDETITAEQRSKMDANEADMDLYRMALDGSPSHACESVDPETGEITEPQRSPAAQMPPEESVRTDPLSDGFETSLAGAEGIADRQPHSPETATRSDQTSKSTAVHIDAGKTGVTAGETAPPFQSSDLHDGRLQAVPAPALDKSRDSAAGVEAPAAPVNPRCLKAQRGEFCKFADKAYSCSDCIQADLQAKARVA